MKEMFYGAHAFNQDISGWDVSKVTDMSSMFYNAAKFDQDISNWDVSKLNSATLSGIFDYSGLSDDNAKKIWCSWKYKLTDSASKYQLRRTLNRRRAEPNLGSAVKYWEAPKVQSFGKGYIREDTDCCGDTITLISKIYHITDVFP
jgi:surface protein